MNSNHRKSILFLTQMLLFSNCAPQQNKISSLSGSCYSTVATTDLLPGDFATSTNYVAYVKTNSLLSGNIDSHAAKPIAPDSEDWINECKEITQQILNHAGEALKYSLPEEAYGINIDFARYFNESVSGTTSPEARTFHHDLRAATFSYVVKVNGSYNDFGTAFAFDQIQSLGQTATRLNSYIPEPGKAAFWFGEEAEKLLLKAASHATPPGRTADSKLWVTFLNLNMSNTEMMRFKIARIILETEPSETLAIQRSKAYLDSSVSGYVTDEDLNWVEFTETITEEKKAKLTSEFPKWRDF